MGVQVDVRSAKDRPKEAQSVQTRSTQIVNPGKGKAFCKQLAEPGRKIYSYCVLFSYLEVWATAKKL